MNKARPYIICHMVCSIDGKVTGRFLEEPAAEPAIREYYRINREDPAQAFACGRVTMEESFTHGFRPLLAHSRPGKTVPEELRKDHIVYTTADRYAVSFDRRGRVGWCHGSIHDDDPGYGKSHIIEVLCENTPVERLTYLRGVGVSYIFAGEEELDLPLALEKLYEIFGITRLLLEGGSHLNGAFAHAGVIDELSLIIAPVTGESIDKPLFSGGSISEFELTGCESLPGGAVWLNYLHKKTAREAD